MLDRHVDVPVGRPGSPVQVTVDVDGPGRYLQQRNVRQHQRRIGGAQRGPAGLVETSSTQCRNVAVVIAEDQESLARAFGQVEHEAVVAPGIRMGDVAEADDGVAGVDAASPVPEQVSVHLLDTRERPTAAEQHRGVR